MTAKENFNITDFVNSNGCFDLQFRKDTRHERTNSPTYYRWKVQFVVTNSKEHIKNLQTLQHQLGCGIISVVKNQARFSVQNMNDIQETVIPYFTKNPLKNAKKKDFELWKKAVHIIGRNKGVALSQWKKNDLLQVMEIHTSSAKYKQKPRTAKWLQMAKTLTEK